MHDIPRKDREDADDVDEDEVAEVSGGYGEPEGGCIPYPADFPQTPGIPGLPDPIGPIEPGFPPRNPDPYLE
jgi:hypothetical protein